MTLLEKQLVDYLKECSNPEAAKLEFEKLALEFSHDMGMMLSRIVSELADSANTISDTYRLDEQLRLSLGSYLSLYCILKCAGNLIGSSVAAPFIPHVINVSRELLKETSTKQAVYFGGGRVH